ncbi:hypothetical protein NC651_037800 [Populus alba x Populus x berolinensis]|nr:hypothetical protein NC651_037800 [Populus alba x Populus x berolinensis]
MYLGGSLERHLHDKKKVKVGVKGSSGLSWSVRYKVALGIAQAIAYLHNGTERCVVHRDIKPSNILLYSKKVPKLCVFGLATWTSAPSVPFLCKTVKGTFGFSLQILGKSIDISAWLGCEIDIMDPAFFCQAKPLLQKGKGAIEELLIHDLNAL